MHLPTGIGSLRDPLWTGMLEEKKKDAGETHVVSDVWLDWRMAKNALWSSVIEPILSVGFTSEIKQHFNMVWAAKQQMYPITDYWAANLNLH